MSSWVRSIATAFQGFHFLPGKSPSPSVAHKALHDLPRSSPSPYLLPLSPSLTQLLQPQGPPGCSSDT